MVKNDFVSLASRVIVLAEEKEIDCFSSAFQPLFASGFRPH